MFPFNLFPYSNFHALNMDWIIDRIKIVVNSVNGKFPDDDGNVNVGTVRMINNTLPDEDGSINLPTVAGVSSVCGIGADGSGNVALTASNVGAISSTITTGAATLEQDWSAAVCEWIKMGRIVYVRIRSLKNETGSTQGSNTTIATGFPIPVSQISEAEFLVRKNLNSPSDPGACIQVRIASDGALKFNYNGSMDDDDVVDGTVVYFTT